MTKILLVQGANLTFLGRREPAIYGTTTAAELDAMLHRHARKHDYVLDIFYSNIEGEAINRIYRAVDKGFDGLVDEYLQDLPMTGFALKDCVKGAGLPYVEVHISNIAKRSIHCVLSDLAEGFITGFGMHSYILGLNAAPEDRGVEGALTEIERLVSQSSRRLDGVTGFRFHLFRRSSDLCRRTPPCSGRTSARVQVGLPRYVAAPWYRFWAVCRVYRRAGLER